MSLQPGLPRDKVAVIIAPTRPWSELTDKERKPWQRSQSVANGDKLPCFYK